VEISDVFIHTDSFLSLSCLNEFDFCLFVSLLVLQLECKFEVDVSYFVFGMQIGHLESFIELAFVREVLNYCIN